LRVLAKVKDQGVIKIVGRVTVGALSPYALVFISLTFFDRNT
jgi:hypothetical protein